eukprot:TRINITY_DN1707_c0_g2_i2.p1 TRINITY_DN1707_c0_g2~~TRINITY_DN1707_c0_g2_i2.p1  ORF type:complete len:459 (+),score=154.32 TRINITY_DN1707_c0_g2_i2:57-1379(+)
MRAAAAVLAVLGSAGAAVPPAKCEKAMAAYCASDSGCVDSVKSKGGALPLVPLFDTDSKGGSDQWRCYSPTCLNANHTQYTNTSCGLFCSRQAELNGVLTDCINASGSEITADVTKVFADATAKGCGMIRTPELAVTPSGILLVGQCRDAPSDADIPNLGDDFRKDRMVAVNSKDGGKTWTNYRYISEKACGVGATVYDAVRKQVVFQYQNFTSSNPYSGNRLFQRISKDDGETWGPEVELTDTIIACGEADGRVCGAAGSRLQTDSGRIVFAGHNDKMACVWYSDDGGESYKTAPAFQGDEISIADLGNGNLYMNGRGRTFPWKGTRTSYRSKDGGATWEAPQECFGVPEPNTFGCEGALLADKEPQANGVRRLFFSEPHGPSSRISFRIWCSKDGGETWPHYVGINKGAAAAYSEGKLLAVWEQNPNMLSYAMDTDWC